jgi:hypothetical protein
MEGGVMNSFDLMTMIMDAAYLWFIQGTTKDKEDEARKMKDGL